MAQERIHFTMFIFAIKTSTKEKRKAFSTTVNILIAFTFLKSFQASGCTVVLLACILVGGALLVSWAGRAGCFVSLFGPWCRCLITAKTIFSLTCFWGASKAVCVVKS